MNTPVNFELAKLLKEKGFNESVKKWWIETLEHELDIPRSGIEVFPAIEPRVLEHYSIEKHDIVHCVAPTITEVVMWLYEKYKIWISVGGDCDYKFKFEIHKWNWYELEKTYRLGHVILGESFWDTSSKAFDSPTEAYEAAIEHALKYLI